MIEKILHNLVILLVYVLVELIPIIGFATQKTSCCFQLNITKPCLFERKFSVPGEKDNQKTTQLKSNLER